MHYLKQLVLFIPLLSSAGAFAEVEMLNDSELSDLSGQAGLSIDYSGLTNLNSLEYIDESLFQNQNINVGGHGHDSSLPNAYYTDHLDNLRINLNLQDKTQTHYEGGFMYGFSAFRELANTYLENGNTNSVQEFRDLASGKDPIRNHLNVDDKKTYDEGDLVIHYAYSDPWEKDGGADAYVTGEGLSGLSFIDSSYQQAENLINRSVDFKYSINEIGLAFDGANLGQLPQGSGNSANTLGAHNGAGSTTTRLMSDFSVQGYLGPHDLHIKEFDSQDKTDNGIAWNSYFKVTDLDVYLDLSGVQISDLEIHNNRGDLSGINLETQDSSPGNSSFGFAHAQREIFSIEDAPVDIFSTTSSKDSTKKKDKKGAIAFNTRFKGDIDFNHFSFGDTGTSIGKIFVTDMYFDSRLTITPR